MKYPCIDCIYFDTCGDPERTMPCYGRETDERETERMEVRDFTLDIFATAKKLEKSKGK